MFEIFKEDFFFPQKQYFVKENTESFQFFRNINLLLKKTRVEAAFILDNNFYCVNFFASVP
jgi:hypothetical protein